MDPAHPGSPAGMGGDALCFPRELHTQGEKSQMEKWPGQTLERFECAGSHNQRVFLGGEEAEAGARKSRILC